MRRLDFGKDPRSVHELANRGWVSMPEVDQRVREILARVQEEGDEAVTTYTREFDCKFIDSLGLRVSDRERHAARGHVSKEFLNALGVARANIMKFHRKQRVKSWSLRGKGQTLRQRVLPMKRVGVYIPGGKAAYPSSVLMNALPARIAGVLEIVMATPCNVEGKISPEVLVAADQCGISEIYRIGGAQAIGAFAFGTESIRRVEKITGPGNAYVASAKRMVFGHVGIDMIAGPTEVVIVADDSARAEFVAADLIAQAEHDENASPILITDSVALAERVERGVIQQLEKAPRRAIAQRAIRQQGTIIVVPAIRQALKIVNELAPEHLEVMTRHPGRFASQVRNAGSIFLGEWSTEALGDYVAGPNHTLPTLGTARFSSALSVNDFTKFTNVIEISRKRFRKLARHVEVLAEAEGLFGHASSVQIRMESMK